MMLSADRTTWTFGQLLDWHLARGTRPEGTPASKGVPWQNKAFAISVGKESREGPKNERTIRNWRNGDTTPSPADLEAILGALFGGKPIYADARSELTERYHHVRRDGETQPKVPLSLPTKPLRCLGRDEDLKSLIEALVAKRDGTAVLVLGGPGIGKTTAARAAAADSAVVDRFGTRRWFAELETATSAEGLEKAITVALGIDPASAHFDATLGLLRQAPGLLVLDNFETPWDSEPEKVEALLTALHRLPNLVLLASMRGNDSPGGVRWTRRRTMHPLEPPHDRELFLDIAVDIRADDPDLDPLLASLGGVPIAIELVAQLAAPHNSLYAIYAEWQRVGVALAKRRSVEPSRLSSLEVSLELSFQSTRLGDAGRRLFAILGQLPAGIAPDDLNTLLGPTAFDARQGLLASGLAFERVGRLDLLPPVRDHARRLRAPSDSDADLWTRHYLALAEVHGEEIGKTEGAVQRLAAELPNLEAAQRAALALGDLQQAVAAQYGTAMVMQFTGLGTPSVIYELAAACRKEADVRGEANCMGSLGDIAFARSDYEAARNAYEQALPLYRQVDDIRGEANCIGSLGDVALARSDYEAARKAYEQALPLYRRVGAILGEANCIKSLGDIALRRSDHETARKAYEKALALCEQIGAIQGEANCIRSLGDIALARSDHEVARKAYEQALPLFRQVGAIQGEASCIRSLGDIALARSDHEVARNDYEEALPLFRQVGDILGEANCIQRLGDIALAQSDREDAHKAFEQALRLYQRIEEPFSIGSAHLTLAAVTEEVERADHLAAARKAWLSIGREDLVKEYGLSE